MTVSKPPNLVRLKIKKCKKYKKKCPSKLGVGDGSRYNGTAQEANRHMHLSIDGKKKF